MGDATADAGDVSAETGSAPRRPGRDFSASADGDEDETTTGHAKYPPGPRSAGVFDSGLADELERAPPGFGALFARGGGARAGVAGDDEVDEDRDALGRPRRLSGPLSADSASAKRTRGAERPGDSDGGGVSWT